MKNLRTYSTLILLISVVSFFGCDDDNEPKREDTPELITKVTLTFSPTGGGSPVVISATDPDGEGVQDLVIDGPIILASDTEYTLNLQLLNELVASSEDGYNITEEIEGEADSHMFFYSWTEGLFSSPAGNGNVDNRADVVDYNDSDGEGLPLGLETIWYTGAASTGDFRLILKHQPDNLKTSSSSSSVGETDLDITFDVVIQ